MKLLLITGPAGAGKNTVARILADSIERCAVVDVDTIRQMLVKPHKAPWEGDEGRKQQMLGVLNAILLAKNFYKNDYTVLILDVLSPDTLATYKEELAQNNLKVVMLLPTFQEIQKRNNTRKKYLKDEEIKMLYDTQQNLVGYDEKIDNTDLSAEEVAGRLKGMLNIL